MSQSQREDIAIASNNQVNGYKSLDYVAGWFFKASDFLSRNSNSAFAFVATNSIVQGAQVGILWPRIFQQGLEITFAYEPFKWKNNASDNAGVICVILGIKASVSTDKFLYSDDGRIEICEHISPYLLPVKASIPSAISRPISNLPAMTFGSMPNDGGHFILDQHSKEALIAQEPESQAFIREFVGSRDLINGIPRYCIWIDEDTLDKAMQLQPLKEVIENVKKYRQQSKRLATRKLADSPHRFGEVRQRTFENTLIIPRHSSVNRDYLPVDLLSNGEVVADSAYGIFNAPIYCLSIIASRMHMCWISTVCGRIKQDYRYSNTLGWHTFPFPDVGENEQQKLYSSAKKILMAREAHYPATIAELYEPDAMPDDLYQAHKANDKLIESIYREKPFLSDQDRLEHLFKRYEEMTAN